MQQQSPTLRPYSKPRLKVYGDMRDLTLTSASQNMNDPGNGSLSMT
jgi:hypothetical protein